MCGNFKRESREILLFSTLGPWRCHQGVERTENVTDGTADMNSNRKSDESVVPPTSVNNGGAEPPAESSKERDSAKRNAELRKRFAKFGLKLHEEKTRLTEFGRYAIERRRERDLGRPETFDFLGFTHMCGKTRTHGWFTVHRHSNAKRMRATLQAVKVKLRQRMHRPLGETGRWLRRVVQGWLNYHAVPSNSRCLRRFVDEVTRHWLRVIRCRSQRGRVRWTWSRMQRLRSRHLPRPRIVHPYPNQRFRARLKVGAV